MIGFRYSNANLSKVYFFVKFKIFGFILRKAEKFRKFLVYVLDVIPWWEWRGRHHQDMRTHLITATEQITSSQRWDAGRDTGICAGVMVAVYIKCCRVAMTIVCRSCGPFHIFLSWCIMMGHWARKQANKGKVGAVLPGASRYLLMRVTSDSSWAPAAGDLEPPSRGTLTPPPADYCCKLCKPTFVKWFCSVWRSAEGPY